MSASLQDELAAFGRARINALKSLGPTALRELPKIQSEDVTVCGKKIMVTVYRDGLPDSRVLIVIQIYRRVFLFYGRMFVVGFIVESSGQISEAESKVLLDYS